MTANIRFLLSAFMCRSSGRLHGPCGLGEKRDALTMQRAAHRFEMHQMRAAADLDVAPLRRRLQRAEQPLCVDVNNSSRHDRPSKRCAIDSADGNVPPCTYSTTCLPAALRGGK